MGTNGCIKNVYNKFDKYMRKKNKNKEVIFDFGEVTIPDKWEDLTLEKFIKLMKLTNDGVSDVRDIISILTDKDKEWINLLPVDFVESMMARLTFLNKYPDCGTSNKVEINDEIYQINVLDKLKFGEYVLINSAIQQDSMDYATIMAIICRKPSEKYSDDWVNDNLEERKELFNKQPITKVLPLVNFILALSVTSKNYSQDYLMELNQTTNQLLDYIKTSVKDGHCKKRSLTWRIKTLWKLRKYSKQLAQLS